MNLKANTSRSFLLKLKVKNGLNSKLLLTAVLDTLSYSIFKTSVAEILDLDIGKGSKEFVKIGDGSFIEVFVFKLPVSIAEEEFEAKVGFSHGLGVGFHIIGRQDIFHKFRVCFDESEKSVEFIVK